MISASGIIEKLPRWPLHRVAESWLNAVRRSIDETLSIEDHDEAERLIAAMHQDWARRASSPSPSDRIENWPVNNLLRRGETYGPQKHTPLTAQGYHVGRRFGLPALLRREILRRCTEEPLMPAFSAETLQAWGEPRTNRRLLRIAEHIAESANSNRNLARNRDAVSDWFSDFSFLKAEYAAASIQWPSLSRPANVIE